MAASNTVKTSGLNWIMKINTSGNNASPAWTTIASQTGGKLTWKNKAIDVTGKDDSGWDAFIPGQGNWVFTCDGVIELSDTGLQQVETAMKTSIPVYIEVTRPDAGTYIGNAILTDLAFDMPYDKASTFTISFQGDQALVTYTI